MKEEKEKMPPIVSDEVQSQTYPPTVNSESVQPLQNIEPILVSEDEYGLPIPSADEHRELENHYSMNNQNKQQRRQKEQKKKKRHGARNQHRHKFFVKWLISTFDLEQSSINSSIPATTAHSSDSNAEMCVGDHRSSTENDNCDHDNNAAITLCESEKDETDHIQGTICTTSISSQYQEPHILDVAGGKGEVSARLTMCHQQRVVMVDPRRADIVDCFERIVLPKIPNKWQRRLEGRREKNPDFIKNTIESRFKQLVTTFDDHKITFDTNQDIEWSSLPKYFGTRSGIAELQGAIQHATLIVGLHADGATEAIVDAALKYHKPFVVVPCCVFPNFFPMRRLVIDQKDGNPPQEIPVRSHEQFCKFLLQKDPRFVMEELPFEGRNVAIWWDGK